MSTTCRCTPPSPAPAGTSSGDGRRIAWSSGRRRSPREQTRITRPSSGDVPLRPRSLRDDEPVIDAGVAAWLERQLGARPVEELFAVSHLSAVTSLRLADGRDVVVKIRGDLARAEACVAG